MARSNIGYALTLLLITWTVNEMAEAKVMRLVRGFPSSITCSQSASGIQLYFLKKSDLMAQCTIVKDNVTLFNETIVSKELASHRIDFIANDTWNGSEVTVSMTNDKNSYTRHYEVEFASTTEQNCKPEMGGKSPTTAKTLDVLPCGRLRTSGLNLRKHFTEEEMQEFQVTWYRNCEPIRANDSRFLFNKYEESSRSDLLNFGLFKVNDSAKNVTGIYTCVVKYGEFSYQASSFSVCVSAPKQNVEREIISQSSERTVEKGSSVNISCTWRVPIADEVMVWWKKGNNTKLICKGNEYPCFSSNQVAGTCESESNTPIFPRHFTSTLMLSNVDESDADTYQCHLMNPKEPLASSVIVIVEEQPKVTSVSTPLVIVLVVLILVMILGIIYYYNKIDILYIYKRKFADCVETDKPITYFIYGDDSYLIDSERNPVNDVRSWLATRGVSFCDPNEGKEWGDTGAPIADRSISLMENCLSLTIFLTPSLLNDNTLELFKAYSGLESNIKNGKFPVVFVCTRDFEKRVRQLSKSGKVNEDDEVKAGISQDTYRTFGKFMQRNFVVFWDKKNKVQFFRSLYVALPKIDEAKRNSADKFKDEKQATHLPIV